ncbi:hypothetical protein GGI02_004299 [Coemansia sp. RSA 2322]|nr:hypothetical protein GGI02_004299 [Coemansia sp. RSA 2322]
MFVYFYSNRYHSPLFMPTDLLLRGFRMATERFGILLGTLQSVSGRPVLVHDLTQPNAPRFEEKAVDMAFSELSATKYAWNRWPQNLDTCDVIEPVTTKDAANSVPLISVLLIRFAKNSGVALRIKIRHSVLDGLGFTSFMSYWCASARQLCSAGKIIAGLDNDILDFDRNTLLQAVRYESAAPSLLVEEPDMSTTANTTPSRQAKAFGMHVIRFTARSLQRLRSDIESGADYVSVNDALTTLLWRSFTRASPPSANTRIMLACDARKRINLSALYMGNASFPLQLSIAREQILVKPMSEVARLVRSRVSQVDIGYIRECLGMLEHNQPILGADEWENNKSTFFCCTNCSRFEFFKTDFGYGEPEKVMIPHYLTPGFSIWLPTKDAGGIDVVISMLDSSFDVLRLDRELLGYGQIII